MAPTTSSNLFPRQGFGGDGNGPGDFGDHRDGPGGKGVSTWAILGIVIAIAVIGLIVAFIIFRRIHRRRRMRRTAHTPTITLHPPSSPTTTTHPNDPSKYSASGGYTATADQNHSLLGNAEAPAIVMWDHPGSASESHADSTQDGFGYDNSLNLVQRPASVASFSAPPPRYEEATGGNNAGGLRPQGVGEAASYYYNNYNNNNNNNNTPARERGRSLTREAPSEGGQGSGRPRALSVDQRSVNGDRRRSFSRFREEGMVDVDTKS
ncbi:hypothetical protein AYO22_03722 [Fonsecaea multimorphosa]|nr:hypothetical protein AYO22_03722 [Fonsecaea multimorphosa]